MQAASPGELPVKEGDLVTVTLPDVGQGWSQVPVMVMVMLGVVVVWVKEGDLVTVTLTDVCQGWYQVMVMVMVVVVVVKGVVPLHEVKEGDLVTITLAHVRGVPGEGDGSDAGGEGS